ncbi:sensor histidine kinase [Xylophilus sp. Leaf220]|uniref:sensor histidine kinase n=1 Tax=Xylophilus sp. Leaf220 TaxID=1735686 RepID=UPI0006FD0551|nr:histidine kinase [Xylophilus sp. Leaf220]KQM80207.1 histidine kinase [Xylophilus sp. Leaf220]
MKEPPILSVPPPPAAAAAAAQPLPSGPFDACRLGVVLRAVLLVETVVGTGVMFGATDALDWLYRLATFTSAVLPATLAWLLAACSLRRLLAPLNAAGQYAACAALGAAAGVAACGLHALTRIDGALPPPWFASACAGALVAVVLVVGLALRAQGRTPAAVTAQLAVLQARIRPHFLFNTLNSAIALVRAEPSRAEALLEDLSDLFRYALVEHGDSTTLGEEIALAQRYLAIEQVRFGDRLRVEWMLDTAADGARVPPLLLQPLVENAVVHGVEATGHGTRVRVSTERRGNVVVIKILNSLPPATPERPAPAREGHGIAQANVRARLALLHDVESDFRAERRGDAYLVRIRLPA